MGNIKVKNSVKKSTAKPEQIAYEKPKNRQESENQAILDEADKQIIWKNYNLLIDTMADNVIKEHNYAKVDQFRKEVIKGVIRYVGSFGPQAKKLKQLKQDGRIKKWEGKTN